MEENKNMAKRGIIFFGKCLFEKKTENFIFFCLWIKYQTFFYYARALWNIMKFLNIVTFILRYISSVGIILRRRCFFFVLLDMLLLRKHTGKRNAVNEISFQTLDTGDK